MNREKQDWKERYNQYIKSEEWYNLKIDLLEKRGCKCEKCGKKRRPTSLHIHHLTYERLYDELPTDLMIMCAICHMKEHGKIKPKKPVVKKSYKKKSGSIKNVIIKYKSGKYKNFSALIKAIKKAK